MTPREEWQDWKRQEAKREAQAELEAELELHEGELCPCCNGSGEGLHEGTTCRACKGKGVV